MQSTFAENRPFLEHEFENACWITDSGLAPDRLRSLLTEFVDTHRHLPTAILRAKAFGLLLDNVQLAINPRSIFCEKLNIGIPYIPFAGQDLFAETVYHRIRHEVLSREMPEEYAQRNFAEATGLCRADADYWHTLPDWSEVLRLGIPGLLQRARDKKAEKEAEGTLSETQSVFYDSVILSYEAMLRWMRRVYETSLACDVPEYSAALKNVTERAPKTLYEVLVCTVIYMELEEIGVERCRSTGRIDQLYLPYYRKALQDGVSIDGIKEMFRYFFLRFQAAGRFAD